MSCDGSGRLHWERDGKHKSIACPDCPNCKPCPVCEGTGLHDPLFPGRGKCQCCHGTGIEGGKP